MCADCSLLVAHIEHLRRQMQTVSLDDEAQINLFMARIEQAETEYQYHVCLHHGQVPHVSAFWRGIDWRDMMKLSHAITGWSN